VIAVEKFKNLGASLVQLLLELRTGPVTDLKDEARLVVLAGIEGEDAGLTPEESPVAGAEAQTGRLPGVGETGVGMKYGCEGESFELLR
jgi:hypothetical protein